MYCIACSMEEAKINLGSSYFSLGRRKNNSNHSIASISFQEICFPIYTKKAFLNVDINLSIVSSVRSRRWRNRYATDVVSYIKISYSGRITKSSNRQQCIRPLTPHLDPQLLKERDALQLVFRISHNCHLFAHFYPNQHLEGKDGVSKKHKNFLFSNNPCIHICPSISTIISTHYKGHAKLPGYYGTRIPRAFQTSEQYYRTKYSGIKKKSQRGTYIKGHCLHHKA